MDIRAKIMSAAGFLGGLLLIKAAIEGMLLYSALRKDKVSAAEAFKTVIVNEFIVDIPEGLQHDDNRS